MKKGEARMTREQCRAGRAFLGWTQGELASRTGLHLNTIWRFENDINIGVYEYSLVALAVTEFEKAGVTFSEDKNGLAVKYERK